MSTVIFNLEDSTGNPTAGTVLIKPLDALQLDGANFMVSRPVTLAVGASGTASTTLKAGSYTVTTTSGTAFAASVDKVTIVVPNYPDQSYPFDELITTALPLPTGTPTVGPQGPQGIPRWNTKRNPPPSIKRLPLGRIPAL